ncbi:MAG TPA: DoxX family protein [Polyangiaceae bacterium]|nr:DoxX family protein [Polyangiaceae bacterium]
MRSKVTVVLSVVLAVYFALNGGLKLASHAHMVESFTRWGYGRSFLFAIGVVEIVSGLALAFRPTASLAGLALGAVMVGATYTHLVYREWGHALLPLFVLPLVVAVGLARGGGGRRWLRSPSASS